MGPVVLLLLWALFTKTRWGLLVRAATQDRSMVAALGCDQRLLFTGVFMLGAALAGFGGALQIPREAVHHGLHIQIIVEAFVVVVVGGMGSVPGAYLAALLVGLVQAFGILIFPQGTMVMVVGTMAAVLAVRPMGLLGRLEPGGEHSAVGLGLPLFPSNRLQRTGWAVLLALAGLAPFFLGPYGLTVLSEILVLALFAAALQLVMGPGGLVSFGHAAYFGLGAYGTALAITYLGLSLEAALIFAPLAGGVGGLLCGLVLTRLSGVYFAMLTLAFAEFIHATTFQWVSVTGGDNGMIGLWPSDWVSGPTVVYGVILVLVVPLLWAIRWLVRSPFGAQLRAARDAPDRAAASGIPVVRVQILAFALSGSLAGLAGGLLVFLKGSVFPTYASIPVSVDALVMVLLGGVHALAGPLLGAASYTLLEILVSAQTDHWRLVVGLVILALVLLFPGGLTSAVGQAGQRLFGLLKSQQRPDAAS
ncbi:MAG: ABC transporter permease subunit [Rhodospirillaceae bacterium]